MIAGDPTGGQSGSVGPSYDARLRQVMLMTEDRIRRLDVALVAIIALAGAAYYLAYFDRRLSLLDEGYLVDPAMRVLRGETPYLDFHHAYAPGRFYLFALLLAAVGPNFLAVRLGLAFLNVLTGAFAYLTTRRLGDRLTSLMVAAVIVIAPGRWYKGFFVFFPILCIWFGFRYLESPRLRRAAAAGIVGGVAFVFRQDAGVYALMAFSTCALWLWLVAGQRRALGDAALYAGGFLLVCGLMFAYFALRGALGPALSDLLLSGHTATSANSLPYPSFFPLWAGNLEGTLIAKLFWLPFLVYATAGIVLARRALTRRSEAGDRFLVLALATGVLVLLQVKNRSGLGHLWQVMPPVCLVGAGLVTMLRRAIGPVRPIASTGVPVAIMTAATGWLIAVALLHPASGSMAMAKGNLEPLAHPAANVRVPKRVAGPLRETIAYLEPRVDVTPTRFLPCRTSRCSIFSPARGTRRATRSSGWVSRLPSPCNER
jgi:hypothetical protein